MEGMTMAKGKKSSGTHSNERVRINPQTGEREKVSGTKAGRKRFRLPFGHPLRTHDLALGSKRSKGD